MPAVPDIRRAASHEDNNLVPDGLHQQAVPVSAQPFFNGHVDFRLEPLRRFNAGGKHRCQLRRIKQLLGPGGFCGVAVPRVTRAVVIVLTACCQLTKPFLGAPVLGGPLHVPLTGQPVQVQVALALASRHRNGPESTSCFVAKDARQA